MKRNILNLLLATVVLVLTACGSNSKRDPIVLDRNVSADGNSTVYHLVNETRVVEVNFANQVKTISVDVVDGQNVGISGVNVSISAVSGLEYGSITGASTVSTNDGGRAIFTYNAPKDIDSVNGQDTTVTLSLTLNGRTISKNVQILFKVLDIEVSEITLINETKSLEVHANNEVRNISVDVVNGNGIGVQGKEVSISAISGMEYGAITGASTVTTDAAGHAIFTYTAPNDISVVEGKSTTVTLSTKKEDNSTISKEVQITFKRLNIVDTNSSKPIVTTTTPTVTLNSNSQNLELIISVFDDVTKTPYSEGKVKVSLPAKSLQGVDVGTFREYSVDVVNGQAIFSYTGPQNLKSLIDNNDLSSLFSFSHEENPENVATITVEYKLQDGYIPANYILSTSSADGNQTMGLKLLKTFTVYLKDDKGTLISDDKINKLTITSKNTTIGKLVSGGSEVNAITLTGANAINSKSFPIQTFTLSGLLPIEIKVDFTDANGKATSRTILMNVVVLSGPPTAINISYAGVEIDSAHASYIEKLVVTVTDTYNNPVNTRPYIAVGAMVEYAVDGSSPTATRGETSPRLFHGLGSSGGKLESIGGKKAQFSASANTFRYVDYSNDKMVTFGQGFVYEALGKWDIFDNTDSVMGLVDTYNGSTRNGLFYAVGHNHRQDLCSADGRKYIGTMKATNYQLDAEGHALIEFQYNYHLTGKDIMIWANLTGLQADTGKVGRLGEAIKHTLRGNGLTQEPSGGYTLGKGESGVAHFAIWHTTAPERYKNGHFSHAIEGGSTCTYTLIDTSNNYDARVCDNGGSTNGLAYVRYSIQAPADKGCTFNITRITTSGEF